MHYHTCITEFLYKAQLQNQTAMQYTYIDKINSTNKRFIRSNERTFKSSQTIDHPISNSQKHNGIKRPQNGLINVDQHTTRMSKNRPKSS